jgi:monofunctional biosynthetic peptidoglycan transglycosylase
VKFAVPSRRWWRRVLRVAAGTVAVLFSTVAYCWLTLPDVRPLRTETPRTTAFMELRRGQAEDAGRKPAFTQRFVPYSRISPTLVRAVLVAEDAAFFDHDGVDYEELRLSFWKNLELGQFSRGASTITQQLAKNLYLSPSRNPYRKISELMIARRLEAELSKVRILELYLNLIEWGDGIWGAQAAAQRYFGIPASALSADQAALLAGAIINPIAYSPARPNARLLRRQQIILGRMGLKTPPVETPVPATTPIATPTPAVPVVPPVLVPPVGGS